MAVPEDNESGRMGRLSLAVVCLSLLLVLVAWGTARAAPPVESYFSCQAVVHPHVHIGKPSKGHAKRHRCRSVKVDATPAPNKAGPAGETATEAEWRRQAQAALRNVETLKADVYAANARTEQVRLADAEVLQQEQTRLTAEILGLRSWAEQVERLTRFLLPFLPAEQRALALSVLDGTP